MKTKSNVSCVDVPSIDNSKLILVASGAEVKVINSEKKAELFSFNPFKQNIGIAKFVLGKDDLAVLASSESNKIEVWNVKK